jgi:hypothetical protein
MIEAKIFNNKLKELDQRFSFIMTHYINNYIQNGLSYDNNNEYYQPYMRLITNLEKLNSELFTLNNQLEQQMIIINKQINKSKQSTKSVTNKYTDNLNIMDSNNALKKMQKDTLLNYSKTNIILFNYLLGSILGIYILRNL